MEEIQLIGKGNFLNDVKEGPWEYFTEEDKQLVKRGNYKGGLMNGVWEFYTTYIGDNGRYKLQKKIMFKNGIESGLFQMFYFGKIIMTGSLKDRIKDGFFEYYSKTGTKEATGFYKDGYKDGEWLSFYEEGQLYERQYWNCKLGWHTIEMFFKQGSVMAKGRYLDKYISGYSIKAHDGKHYARINLEYDYKTTGEPSEYLSSYKSNYLGGSMDGVWEYYFENGNLSQRGEYKDRNEFVDSDRTDYRWVSLSTREMEDLPNKGKEGLWEYFYETGTLKESINFSRGIKQGERKEYHPSGKLKLLETYIDGLEEGTSYYYYETGELRRIERGNKGKAHGQWEYFSFDGNIELIENYNHNKLQGLREVYFSNGMINSRENWASGERNGKCEFFHENGRLEKSGYWENEIEDGKWEYYNENGELIGVGIWDRGIKINGYFDEENCKSNWKNGLLDGRFESYYDSGQLCERGLYVLGKKDGIWENYSLSGLLNGTGLWQNGEKYDGYFVEYHDYFIVESISNYKHGLKDGSYEQHYFEFSTEKCEYKEGKRNGFYESYQMRILNEKGEYLDDAKSGLWEFFDENGCLRMKGRFNMGKRDDLWEYYMSSGELRGKGIWKNDEKFEGHFVEYNNSWEIESESNYKNGVKETNCRDQYLDENNTIDHEDISELPY